MPSIQSSTLSYLRFINLNIKRRGKQERNTRLYMCSIWPREQPEQKKSKMKTFFDLSGEDGRPQRGMVRLHKIEASSARRGSILSQEIKSIFRQVSSDGTSHELHVQMFLSQAPKKARLRTRPDIRHDVLIIYFNNFISFHVFWIVSRRSSARRRIRITPETNMSSSDSLKLSRRWLRWLGVCWANDEVIGNLIKGATQGCENIQKTRMDGQENQKNLLSQNKFSIVNCSTNWFTAQI